VSSVFLLTAAIALVLTPAPTQSQSIELVGDFPSSTASWGAPSNASATVEGGALRLAATNAGAFGVCSGILGGVEGGWTVTPGASLDSDPQTLSPTTTLDFLDAGFVALGSIASAGVAPEGTAYVRLCVGATAVAGGAELVILSAMISASAPVTATATAAASETATASATATASETGTAIETATASATATASVTATATTTATTTPSTTPTSAPPPEASTAAPEGAGDGLRNADFELGGSGTPLYWDERRGAASAEVVAGGTGRSALITSGRSTSWIEQLVPASSGRWYEATARLAALDGVDAGWVRIAWYASSDGSGGQTATEDSASVEGGDGAWVTVSTGAVQAPEGTRSARVRILVRPGDRPAHLGADDVTFEETSAPTVATQTATPSPTSTPPSTPEVQTTASPRIVSDSTDPQASDQTPGAGSADTPTSTQPPAVTSPPPAVGPVELLRITEVLADPAAPGNDAGFEWVELTNFGGEAVWLTDAIIEDAAGRTTFELHLEPGVTLVVAASEAMFDSSVAVQRVERIGNGLRNDGDLVRMLSPDGVVIDEVRWGDIEAAELRPGSGESVERWFDEAGTLLGERIGAPPSPGATTEPPGDAAPGPDSVEAAESAGAATPRADTASVASPTAELSAAPIDSTVGERQANGPLWLLLFTLAGAGLGGLAVYRVTEIWRDHRNDGR
jgi:hypothetical protein